VRRVSYNVDGAAAGMHLTGTVVADIYLGRITRWDDPPISDLNLDRTLPHEPVTVVHRSDGCGTAYIFTHFLRRVSPAWASGPGTGKSIAWPAGVGASGNQGVANAVRTHPGAIGYVDAGVGEGRLGAALLYR
jgi:phosphate transport system substrate-binding protein